MKTTSSDAGSIAAVADPRPAEIPNPTSAAPLRHLANLRPPAQLP